MKPNKPLAVTEKRTLTVRWTYTAGKRPCVRYYVDDLPVGEGERGFDRVIEAVKLHRNMDAILKISKICSFGGGNLVDSLPFSDRVNELRQALGENKIIYDFF